LPYPVTRYYQMVTYNSAHHQPKPWHGSLLLAQWEEFPTILQGLFAFSRESVTPDPEARIASINLTCANLWLLKAAKLGFLPWPIAGALALVFLAAGVGLVGLGLRNPSVAVMAPREMASRAVAGR